MVQMDSDEARIDAFSAPFTNGCLLKSGGSGELKICHGPFGQMLHGKKAPPARMEAGILCGLMRGFWIGSPRKRRRPVQ
jgi:hypothetical protein